jgi:hypothetical protein
VRPLGEEEKVMKYMTSDLLARFRSPDDAVAEAASAEWQRQGDAYLQHLKEIRPNLASGARRLLRYSFHDAKVLTMAADDVPHFSFVLELDDPVGRGGKKCLELKYRLVGGPGKGFDMVQHKELAGDGKQFGWWLYDEFDLSAGDIPVTTHSILFTGGWELQLRFFSVRSRRLDFFSLPADERGLVDPKLEGGKWAPLKAALKAS